MEYSEEIFIKKDIKITELNTQIIDLNTQITD